MKGIQQNKVPQGRVTVPPSKSLCHRAIMAAALARGTSVIHNIVYSEDIEATLEAVEALGADVLKMKNKVVIMGKGQVKVPIHPLNCRESGSTLRFFVPLVTLVGEPVVFTGQGRLMERPLKPYFDIFKKQGIRYFWHKEQGLMVDGTLKAGNFELVGNVSSQFITGLMYALPLLDGDSRLTITGELESRDYVTMTMAVLKSFGITIEDLGANVFFIEGNQRYVAADYWVEGDYSQSAFWIAAGLMGKGMTLLGMQEATAQGDRRILDIVSAMGGSWTWDQGELKIEAGPTWGTVIDAAQCPDLVPIVATLAAVSEGRTLIINAERVRIKESDRLKAICTELNKLGANIKENQDGLVIEGVKSLKGGPVESWNDHRIAMSLAVASIKTRGPVTIAQSGAVKKSYPHFFETYAALGGEGVEHVGV